MSRVVHFDIVAQDPARASKFYESVFGWSIQKWDGPTDYWLVSTGPSEQPGIDGGIMQVDENWPGIINTIDVDSVDATVATITQHGGQVVHPKMPIPGVGWLAYCKDTEGNLFGIMEADEAAGSRFRLTSRKRRTDEPFRHLKKDQQKLERQCGSESLHNVALKR